MPAATARDRSHDAMSAQALDRLRAAHAAARRLPAVLAGALALLERAARDGAADELAALAESDGLVLLSRGRPALLLLADDALGGYLLAALPPEATATGGVDRSGLASVPSRSDRVLTFVRSHAEPTTAAHVAGGGLGVDVDQARVYLSRLCRAGRIERVGRGEYVPAPSERNRRNRRNNVAVSSVSSEVGVPTTERAGSAGQQPPSMTPRPSASSRPAVAVPLGEPDWPRIAQELRGELDEDGTPTAWPFIVSTHAALTCETPGCGRPVCRRAYRGAPVHCAHCWGDAAAAALRQAEAEAPRIESEARSNALDIDGDSGDGFGLAGPDDGRAWG